MCLSRSKQGNNASLVKMVSSYVTKANLPTSLIPSSHLKSFCFITSSHMSNNCFPYVWWGLEYFTKLYWPSTFLTPKLSAICCELNLNMEAGMCIDCLGLRVLGHSNSYHGVISLPKISFSLPNKIIHGSCICMKGGPKGEDIIGE